MGYLTTRVVAFSFPRCSGKWPPFPWVDWFKIEGWPLSPTMVSFLLTMLVGQEIGVTSVQPRQPEVREYIMEIAEY